MTNLIPVQYNVANIFYDVDKKQYVACIHLYVKESTEQKYCNGEYIVLKEVKKNAKQ